MPKDIKQERLLLRSKVTQYPEKILDKVDDLIRRGSGATNCLKVIALNYEGPLVPVSRDTMEKYLRGRRKQLDVEVNRALEAERAFINLNPLPDIRSVDPKDKRGMLDVILRTLASRVEEIKEIQQSQADPRYEKILAEALAEMRETISMQVKLDEKLGFERTRIQAILTVLLGHISSSVSQAYKDVHGEDKLESFIKSLEKRLDTLPFEVIETEVMSVVTEQGVIDITEGK